MTPLVEQLVAAYTAAANPNDAAAMRSYMRDQFEFLGIKKPERTALLRTVLAEHTAPDQDELVTIVDELWARPEREYQYTGAELCRKWIRRCDSTFLDPLECWITTKSWWDSVDALAYSVGELVGRDPALVAMMDRWLDDDDFWLARAAILHQLWRRADCDQERLFRYCLARAGDREFFVRKAIGWALRTHARVAPAAVRAFVDEHRAELSPLSIREATKHL